MNLRYTTFFECELMVQRLNWLASLPYRVYINYSLIPRLSPVRDVDASPLTS